MELPSFDMADPWVTLDPTDRYYLVSIRLKDGVGIFSLARSNQGERDAVKRVLGNVKVADLRNIKDVRAVDLSEVDAYAPREIEEMVKELQQ